MESSVIAIAARRVDSRREFATRCSLCVRQYRLTVSKGGLLWTVWLRGARRGRPRVRGDVDGAVRDLTGRASAVLDRIEPLTSVRLGVVKSCDKQPRARLYDINLDVMTGYAELFSAQRLRSRCPFDEETVLAYSPNSLEYAVDLTPYCVWRRCPTCGRDELFSLTKCKLGSRRSEAAHGWRASWADLAPRHRRLAARAVDTALAAIAASVGWLLGLLIGLPALWAVVLAVVLAATYEPVSALIGRSVGKRLIRIEAISTWDCRPLGTGDLLRRALVADLQLIPLFAVYNLAWLLWDPARQCLHDRYAGSIVVAGRSHSAQKR
jgi:uncharacterized RDD family membrane protein YckC